MMPTDRKTKNPRLAAALAYIQRGFAVLPCHSIENQGLCSCAKSDCPSPGKHPRTKNGLKDASTDPAAIRAWWKRWPNANVAIATGIESGLVVLDIDPRHGGDLSIEAFIDCHGELPDAPEVVTGSKGRHIYLRRPPVADYAKLKSTTNFDGLEGLDVRADGGYVVAPPSNHLEGGYAWDGLGEKLDLPPAPKWLCELLAPRKRTVTESRPTAGRAYGRPDEDEIRAALQYVDPNCDRDTWVNVGMGLISWDPARGIDLRDEWSRPSAKYKGREDLERRNLTPDGGITIATVFGLAKERGWEPSRRKGRDRDDRADGPPLSVSKGAVRWKYGAEVWRVEEPSEKSGKMDAEKGAEPTYVHLATSVWPIARTQPMDSGAPGIRIDYEDTAGRRRSTVIPAAAVTDRHSQTAEGSRLAAEGVQITTGQGAGFVEAIGRWRDLAEGAPTEQTVSKPGWHRGSNGRRVYVNRHTGRVHGAEWTWTGADPIARPTRAVGEVAREISRLATTPGTRLALAVSLSGPMLGPFGAESGIWHLHARSSCGKTSAARLAGYLWAPPTEAEGSPLATWDSTANAAEFMFEAATDAYLALDELKRSGSPWTLRDIIHRLASGLCRKRSNRQGAALMPHREWRVAVLSTGEVSIADRLGDEGQGGEAVRAIDIELRLGEATESAEHAEKIAALCRDASGAGVVGDAWVAYLAGLEVADWRRLRAELEAVRLDLRADTADAEAGRIADRLALLAVAGDEAHRVLELKLGDGIELARWALRRILDTRESASPEERAWAALRRHRDAHPAEWPSEEDYDDARTVVGLRSGDELWTTEDMLRNSGIIGKAGCSPRRFLTWAREKGLARNVDRCRFAGLNRRWTALDLDQEPFQCSTPESDRNAKWNTGSPKPQAGEEGICSNVPLGFQQQQIENLVVTTDPEPDLCGVDPRTKWNTGTDGAHTRVDTGCAGVPLARPEAERDRNSPTEAGHPDDRIEVLL